MSTPVSEPQTLFTLPALPTCIPTLTNVQAAALDVREPGGRVWTPKNCLTCLGSKTFRWYDPANPGSVVTYQCSCDDQYMLYRWLLHSGIPLNYQRLSWLDFNGAISDNTGQAMGDYIDHSRAYISSGLGMIVHGETKGTGKTMCATLLLKGLIATGVSVYATTFSDMVRAFMGTWQDREQSRWFNRTVRSVQVLYIDDLGREYGRAPGEGLFGVAENMLETIVRARVGANQPTIITTNLSEEEIANGYGGHTMSLLTECSLMVPVTGQNYRPQKNEIKATESRLGLSRPVVLQ